MSSRKTTGVAFDLVPVAMTSIGNQRTTRFPQIAHNTPALDAAHRRTAVGNQRTTCFPQIAHYTPAFVAAHRRTAVGNQRTTCFPQIAHYTLPTFVAAHRRRSLFAPAVRSFSKSQNWIRHRPAALCNCHSLNPLHASVLKQGPSSSRDFSAEIPPAEPVVLNIDIVTGS